MRYNIVDSKIVPSTNIDAPYDTEEDALAVLLDDKEVMDKAIEAYRKLKEGHE